MKEKNHNSKFPVYVIESLWSSRAIQSYAKLKIPKLEDLIKLKTAAFVYKFKSQKLSIHKTSGYDNISFFLRLGNEILAPILSVYFGVMFELGFFPQILKTAKVVPIFKAGDKHLVRNHCPISLLPCLSKVLEKVIKNRFINFFEKHEIFHDFQYGFREKRDVMHALLYVIIPVYDAIEHNKFTALLVMDSTK